MWNTVSAWLAASVPSVSTNNGDSSQLQTALLSLGGACIGAIALVYTSRFKKSSGGDPKTVSGAVEVPNMTPTEDLTLATLVQDQADLQRYFERRKQQIDDRFDETNRRFDEADRRSDRFNVRIGDLEDRIDRFDRQARWDQQSPRDSDRGRRYPGDSEARKDEP